MFRNLIFGSLLAPLGAALPFVVIALVLGLLGSIVAISPYPLTAGIGQSLFVIYGAYVFGWIAALLIGAGNGLVWLLVPRPAMRVLLSMPVGGVAVLVVFGNMLFGVGGLEAWPSLALFCVQGIVGSFFSVAAIAISSAPPSEVPA